MRFVGVVGALYGLLAVALGAFAAHALSERLEPEALAVFETGVRYQAMHALALVACALLALFGTPPRLAAWAFALGVPLFSFSLYGLALGGPRWLGPITPIGGTLFLVGWAALGMSLFAASRRAPRG